MTDKEIQKAVELAKEQLANRKKKPGFLVVLEDVQLLSKALLSIHTRCEDLERTASRKNEYDWFKKTTGKP